MKFLPDFKTVLKTAAEGKYDIIPVSCELLSDLFTPIEVMKVLKNVSTHMILLIDNYDSFPIICFSTWGRSTQISK